MGDIKSKKDDARSIVKDLADTLDEKSLAEGTLVVRAETEASQITNSGSQPVNDYPSDLCKECYDPNTDSYDQECVNKVLSANAVELRKTMDIVKSQLGEVLELARRNDVSDAEKKHAKKEYGDVTYADAENNKYPIDTEEHIRAAWNYIHQERNAAKYSDNGAAIKKKILAAWKRVIGGEPPSVEKSAVEELSMNDETVNKMQLGGENVEEKQFEYDALGVKINGDPQKNVVPNPIKGKVKDAMDKEETEETPDDEKREKEREGETKSVMDKAFAQMKALVAKGASVEEVNQAFASLGSAVEQEYQPKAQPVDMNNLAEIVKSAVASAVAPLQIEIAQLKAGNTVSKSAIKGQAPLPRSLTIRPQELLQKTIPANQAPVQQLSQIQKIARKTVGLDSGQ